MITGLLVVFAPGVLLNLTLFTPRSFPGLHFFFSHQQKLTLRPDIIKAGGMANFHQKGKLVNFVGSIFFLFLNIVYAEKQALLIFTPLECMIETNVVLNMIFK